MKYLRQELHIYYNSGCIISFVIIKNTWPLCYTYYMATLRLYQSTPYPCPYLPEYTAHHHISDPNILLSPKLYSSLIDVGFRRAGERIHRPNCIRCKQCISLRVPVAKFNLSKGQRRLIKKNTDLETTIVDCPDYSKYFTLYQQYISNRHPDSENMQNVADTFENFLFSRWAKTFSIEFRLGNKDLVCVAICDPLLQGWSAVYTFYDPAFLARGLGTYAIVEQIKLLQESGLDYLYLGYWIKDCDKMSYKTRFKPCEVFKNEQWRSIDE